MDSYLNIAVTGIYRDRCVDDIVALSGGAWAVRVCLKEL